MFGFVGFFLTLPKFYIVFILSPTPFLLRFHFVFFDAITEFELDLFIYDNLCSLSQVIAQHFSSFAVWPVSILVLPRVHKYLNTCL